jgi:cell division protein FtsB
VGVKRLKQEEEQSQVGALVARHGRTILGLLVLALFVHDIFGAHGFIAMRRTQSEIEKVRKDLDRLNKENVDLGDQVRALKTDPAMIEKIAREDLQRAKPGEIIIRIPASQQPAPDSHAKR